MVDVDAEAAFLSQLQAANENDGGYDNTGDASGQHIDSSDEYDPAQDVQDVSASGPQNLPNPSSFVDSSVDDPLSHDPTSVQHSLSPSTGMNMVIPSNSQVQDDLSAQPQTSARSSATGTPQVDNAKKPGPATQANMLSQSAASATPKARLPHDRIGLLEDRIAEDPKGDMDAWLGLINEHRKRGKLDEARKVYDRFFVVFPSAAEQWVALIQLENEAENKAGVEAIFQKVLTIIPSLPLWSAYLDHIRRHFNITTDKSGQASLVNHQAYEAVLDAIGIDKESGKIWQDYIQFIKSGPGIVGGSTWQDQQKMDLLRKVYQRAICIPTQVVESIWREYSTFEMSLNKLTGRKFLQEKSPAYMTARSSYTELQNMTRDLKRTTLPALPPALGFDGEVEYMKQVELWRRWVQWEKDDPLVLKEEDKAGYKARIIFVYHQALMALRFWPEMWFDAAEFCFNNNLEAEGKEFLLQGIGANPESSLLAFKRAERLELSTTNGNDDESKARRGAVVREPYDKLLDALYVLIGKAMAREARDISRIEAEFAEASNSTKEIDHDNDREEDDNERKAQEDDQKKQVSISIVKTMNTVQTSLLNKTISHAWIALMRCMQRMQGKGKVGAAIGGSRQIFTESRKRGRITSDVWIAAAMLEFHAFDGESAKRIFERGMKLFPDDERYALEYVKHLIATNDHTNARVVFETTVGKLSQKPETAAKAKPLYAFFHDFESRYGELSQIVKLEKRMREAFPDDPRLAAFSQRFVHEGFDPTAIRPIISPAIQAKPKAIPSIDTFPPTVESPPNRFVQVTGTNSPKRPMQFEESDNEANRPRKLPRAESPLKGAAGRRLDQQKRNRMPFDGAQYDGQTPAHLIPSLPRDVLFLLSIIPPASTYHATRFKPEEMVRLIQDTHLPGSASQLRLPPQPPPGGAGMPRLPPGQFNGQYIHNR